MSCPDCKEDFAEIDASLAQVYAKNALLARIKEEYGPTGLSKITSGVRPLVP